MERRGMDAPEIERRVNIGTLLASGMIAGEALMAILLAIAVNAGVTLPALTGSGLLALPIFAIVAIVLVTIPVRAPDKPAAPAGFAP
jgi:hypothetical protein